MAESPTDVHGRIFISYRREDAAYPAGWLFDRLAERFGNEQIFKDVDSIELGDDFVEVIGEAVGSTDVLLALIGDRWLTVVDEDGDRRLEDPEDFVRLEIEAALTRKVRVIPILVEGAKMPREDQLPPSLSPLARRQALELSPSRFAADTGKLLAVLEKTLAEATAPGKEGSAGPAIETPEPRERKRPPPTDPKVPPEPPETPARRPGLTDRRRLLLAIAGAALLVALLVGGVVLLSGGDDSAQETTGPESPPAQDDDGSSDAAVNGRIAFVSDEEIWDALPDGSGLRQLTRGFAAVRRPEWSPDGTKVAFASNRGNSANDYDLWILDTADESTTRLTMGPAEDGLTDLVSGRNRDRLRPPGARQRREGHLDHRRRERRAATGDRRSRRRRRPRLVEHRPIAFESKRNGGYEIYTLDPAGPRERGSAGDVQHVGGLLAGLVARRQPDRLPHHSATRSRTSTPSMRSGASGRSASPSRARSTTDPPGRPTASSSPSTRRQATRSGSSSCTGAGASSSRCSPMPPTRTLRPGEPRPSQKASRATPSATRAAPASRPGPTFSCSTSAAPTVAMTMLVSRTAATGAASARARAASTSP